MRTFEPDPTILTPRISGLEVDALDAALNEVVSGNLTGTVLNLSLIHI